MKERLDELINIANGISRGEIPKFQYNECFTSGAFDLLLINVYGAEAFELLSKLCSRFSTIVSQPENVKGFYLLASQLASRKETTEIQKGMKTIINSNPELSKELQKWYRYNC